MRKMRQRIHQTYAQNLGIEQSLQASAAELFILPGSAHTLQSNETSRVIALELGQICS
jgi:hypothetical protein